MLGEINWLDLKSEHNWVGIDCAIFYSKDGASGMLTGRSSWWSNIYCPFLTCGFLLMGGCTVLQFALFFTAARLDLSALMTPDNLLLRWPISPRHRSRLVGPSDEKRWSALPCFGAYSRPLTMEIAPHPLPWSGDVLRMSIYRLSCTC